MVGKRIINKEKWSDEIKTPKAARQSVASPIESEECAHCQILRESVQKMTKQLKELVKFGNPGDNTNVDFMALAQKITQTQLSLTSRCKNFESSFRMKEEECKKANELRSLAEASCKDAQEKLQSMIAERQSLENKLSTASEDAKQKEKFENEVKILQSQLRAANEKKFRDYEIVNKVNQAIKRNEHNLLQDVKQIFETDDGGRKTAEEPKIVQHPIEEAPRAKIRRTDDDNRGDFNSEQNFSNGFSPRGNFRGNNRGYNGGNNWRGFRGSGGYRGNGYRVTGNGYKNFNQGPLRFANQWETSPQQFHSSNSSTNEEKTKRDNQPSWNTTGRKDYAPPTFRAESFGRMNKGMDSRVDVD